MVVGVILGIVFAILAIVAGVAAYCCFDNSSNVGGTLCVIACIALVIAFICVPFSFRTVQTGEIAVVKQFGEAKEVRTAGMHYDFWMTNSYTRYDTKVQNVEIVTSAYSSDAQTMDIAMTLQYQILEDKAIDIAKEYGTLDVLQNRIQSIAIEKTKSTLSAYKAMDIIADRATMSPLVETAIKDAIGEKYFVSVSAVVLTNIDFSDAFEKAVEDKMIAEQTKLKAEYDNAATIAAAEAAAAAKIKAQEAEAQALIIAAQAKIDVAKAEAMAKEIAAQGTAEAQQIQVIQVARMLGLTELVNVLDDNGNPVQATNDKGELLYMNNSNQYTTEAKTGNTDNTPVYVKVEQLKSGLTTEEAQKITDYIEYLKYMEIWNGELPDTIVSDGASIILPKN